jgi:hypothetical protein
VIVTGDLLTAPYVVPRSGFPADYARSLRALSQLEASHCVLGHGGPVKANREWIEVMAGFLSAVHDHAAGALHESIEVVVESALASAEIAAYQSQIDWTEPGLRFLDFPSLVRMTAERAFLEVHQDQ